PRTDGARHPLARSSSVTPGGAQAVAVSQPENRGHDEQHGFVERSGNRCESNRGEPAQPTGQPAVAGEQPDCSEDPPQGGGSVAAGVAAPAPLAYCVDGGDARHRTGEDGSLEPVAAREAPKPDPRGDRAHYPDDPFGYQSLRHPGPPYPVRRPVAARSPSFRRDGGAYGARCASRG